MNPQRNGAANLTNVLACSHWSARVRPFAHITGRDVFADRFYQQMAAAFQALLDRGLSTTPDPHRLSRSLRGYDAYICPFSADADGPLSVFLSRPWHDLIAGLTGVRATGDVNGGFHHHQPGSASGTIHNDLNPGWFVDRPRPDGVNPTRLDSCSYYDGQTRDPSVPRRETVRAVAVLFYLNNPAWSAGDGGETGLYESAGDPPDRPAVGVPPINNSLLLFECTPFSFHTFLSNHRHPRNSVIMWLHRAKTEVVGRWGESSIVYWSKR